jgi:hypothetical protein
MKALVVSPCGVDIDHLLWSMCLDSRISLTDTATTDERIEVILNQLYNPDRWYYKWHVYDQLASEMSMSFDDWHFRTFADVFEKSTEFPTDPSAYAAVIVVGDHQGRASHLQSLLALTGQPRRLCDSCPVTHSHRYTVLIDYGEVTQPVLDRHLYDRLRQALGLRDDHYDAAEKIHQAWWSLMQRAVAEATEDLAAAAKFYRESSHTRVLRACAPVG